MDLPKHYDFKASEKKWKGVWKNNFKADADKPLYTIDTPPPTVSGQMHIGHSFSYSQQDFIARYKRMRGYNVFYPFGTDDNGLPTERLVERLKKVKSTRMGRKEFRELCLKTIDEIKPGFVQPWIDLAISCDFKNSYSTIDEDSQRISQESFIHLYGKGRVYQEESPITWCTTCQTAIAQAEFENVDMKSHFHDIVFHIKGKEIVVATTRPELIPACVALFHHPDDERHVGLKGSFAKVPIFDYEVPILSDESVDKDKGTGLMMVCTFGDKEDIDKWHRYKLPLRVVFDKNGTMNELAADYKGLKIMDARKKLTEDLKERNLLINQKEIEHAVNLHERCGTEVEFLKTKQWFIKVLDKKEELIQVADSINWYPVHMKVRYIHWVENLNWDWCISRQRHYGVPIPVWYCSCGKVLFPEKLPADPLTDKPKMCTCGSEKYIPETDVLDTWATSSLTPQIALDRAKLDHYPMSLRPQAHDIIRTWAFYTIVKGVYGEDSAPWKDMVISGHALDPNGRKMSKSRGNVVDPIKTMEKYGTDAVRFWAAGSKLGEDLPFMEKDLVTGQKMVTKMWNASKFCFIHLEDFDQTSTPGLEMMDRWILSRLNRMIKSSTDSFERYEYSRTKSEVEQFFWKDFCDNYLEIVKARLYNPDIYGRESSNSARFCLYHVLLSVLKLTAPIMPFISEEIYSMYYAVRERTGSIHDSAWPEWNEVLLDDEAEPAGDIAVEVVSTIRRLKSEQKLSLKALVKKITVHMPKKDIKALKDALPDVKSATSAEEIELVSGELLSIHADF